jgi:hypothetical protein
MTDTMIEGLSGTEIIADVLDQIKRKLSYSCDLRESDSYGGGYSGSIEIHLKLHAMDNTPVDVVVPIQPKAEPLVSNEAVTVIPIQVEETLEIPQEEDLESVRERLKISEPEPLPETTEAEEGRMPARLKRKYTRRTGVPTLEQTAQGGAVDVDE